jgi:lipid A 4'-phosphatase
MSLTVDQPDAIATRAGAASHASGAAMSDRQLFRFECFAGASFAGLSTALIFLSWPELDIAISRQFFAGDVFTLNQDALARGVRAAFRYFFIGVSILVVAGLLVEIFAPRRLFGLSRRRWMFLVAALLIGPGLIANTVFKDNWGRARPLHLVEFGRDKVFTPAIERSDQCRKNCAFVGGDAAAIYAVFFAVAMVAPLYRRRWMAAGIVLGSAVGVLRIGQGGHFASDIIFAGVFMALTIVVLDWLFSLGDEAADL